MFNVGDIIYYKYSKYHGMNMRSIIVEIDDHHAELTSIDREKSIQIDVTFTDTFCISLEFLYDCYKLDINMMRKRKIERCLR